MSNRSKSPPPKSSKIVDSSEFGTSIDVDDDLIVNGKISGNTALNIINQYYLIKILSLYIMMTKQLILVLDTDL